MVKTSELQPHRLQKIRETTTRLRSNTKEPILIWVQNEFWLEWNPGQQDQRNGVLPKGSLLRMSNSASRQDLDSRVPDKGTLQVPTRRNPEFDPWNRAPFQEMENF
ncbi:hypothetical protein F2Q69_00029269 [Brassica cretica]|uniref:Uncharacterized protein n=1 Tax=Brassica cretica TaxID=69181 RepID=A0A8S9S027_BRACR|nr:hypothetical protein F2Q69_00029269 [Brassica cretica]